MNFTFKIENYFPFEERAFAVYETDGFEPLGAFFPLSEGATESEILLAAQRAAPLDKWLKRQNPVASSLLGRHQQGVEQAKPEAPASFPEPAPQQLARHRRNALLRASDWTQLPDAPLDVALRASWAGYRTALRNVPQQQGFPEQIEWPKEPPRP